MSASRENLLRRGVDAPPPAREALRAGPLAMELEGADLRAIRLGDAEVVRHLYVAVRDRNWGTVPAVVSGRVVESDGDSFSVSFLAEHRRGEVDFAWRGTIRGSADGTIAFRMDGEARSTFLRNRIGFCLLHPIRDLAGRPCAVEAVDGTIRRGAFPDRISPHQPFKDMRAISHEVRPGLRAEVRLEGETFEMEDQRNWTDGSYKTYGTPLEIPFPVEVPRGARIEQTATIRLIGAVPDPGAVPDRRRGPATIAVGRAPIGRLPRIGLGLPSHGRPPTALERDRLRALNLWHLRLDLHLRRPGFADRLAEASRLAGVLGVALEVAVFVSDAAEDDLAALARAVERERPPVASWLVFHDAEKATGPRWVELARRFLGGAPIGAGSNVYFTEVNRGYPPVPPADLLAYSINPQVHTFDDASIVESLEAQPETVASARELSGGLPVAVTPITLRPRFNPNATGPEPEPAPGELPAQVDPRQASLFGAGWTLGTIAALGGAGASSLTFFETTGWRGVMELDDGPPLPDRFPSGPGSAFPMYHVFADVGAFAGGDLLPADPGAPLGVSALAMASGDRLRVLVANLAFEPKRVRVEGLGRSARVRLLDETNAEAAMRLPEAFLADPGAERPTPGGVLELELKPYGLARVDASDRGGGS